MEELLIIFGPDKELARSAIRRDLHVVNEVSPYIFTVHGDSQKIKSAAALSNVLVGSRLNVNNNSVISQMSPAEQMFVYGWLYNRKNQPRIRIGDGLPWDAPGFKGP